MHLEADGSCRLNPASRRWHDRVEAAGESVLLSYWQLYRMRELLHASIFGGSAADAVGHVRRWLATGAAQVPSGDLYELELLLRARARFATINLDPANPQRRGFEHFLHQLHDAGWPTLLFYTRENPAVRDALIEPATYQRLHEELEVILQPYLTPRLRYHPGIERLEPRHYLDHLHVDAAGYRRLFDRLWPDVHALLAP